MLKLVCLSFLGRPHSGIDDSKNIAKIAIELLKKDGFEFNQGMVIEEQFTTEKVNPVKPAGKTGESKKQKKKRVNVAQEEVKQVQEPIEANNEKKAWNDAHAEVMKEAGGKQQKKQG